MSNQLVILVNNYRPDARSNIKVNSAAIDWGVLLAGRFVEEGDGTCHA